MDVIDFIPDYADQSDPEFTEKITSKKEFYDLRLEPTEDAPDEAGGLLHHQQFIQRFLSPETPYPHCLLFHGLGSGKTCTASAVVESYKNTLVDDKPRKPALIFVRSGDLRDNFRREIANVCTKNVYLPKTTRKELEKGVELTEEAKIGRLNKSIRKTYDIVSFGKFLRNLPSDDIVKRKYSNRIIVIDEAHHFRIQPKTKKTKMGVGATGDIEYTEEDVTMLYNTMHHFLHTVEKCRILLLTGTPIWDQTSEIASLMNLILPDDQQLPTGNAFMAEFFDNDGNMINETVLRDRFRGKISFLRSMITTAKRIEMGTKQPWLKYLTVYPDGMSEFQADYARLAKDKEEVKEVKVKGKIVERTIKGGTVYNLAQDAANFVFPVFDKQGNVIDGEYGQQAFKKYAVKTVKRQHTTKDGKVTVNYVDTYAIDNPYLQREIKNNLAEYGIKFASIIDAIKKHPNELVYIYMEAVTGAGAILLGLILQLHGFQRAKTAADIERPSEKKRFVVMTSDPQTTSAPRQISDVRKSFNAPDNKYGDRLQIIIASEKFSEGVSLKNVRQVHIAMPHWNVASIDQAKFRAIRFLSHEDLPPEERYIRTYLHMAVERAEPDGPAYAKGMGFPADVAFSDYETINAYIYSRAEEKEYKNAQIYRLLKEMAFDCALNYKRNVLEGDTEGSRDCDFQQCNYQCDGFPSVKKTGKVWDYSIPADRLDTSTYNLFYSSGRIKEIIDAIAKLFNNYFSLRIDTVQDLIQIDDNEKVLMLQAIDVIINSRMLIRSRYGFGSYLKEEGNILFLDNNITPVAKYAESTYMENPLITDRSSLEALIEIMELDIDRAGVLKFCKKPSEEVFETLSYKTKIILLEVAYATSLQKMNATQRTAVDIVMSAMGDNIYELSDGAMVHILYTEEFRGLAYDVAAKDIQVTGLMRVYNPTSKVWKYVSDVDAEEQYVEEIRSQLGSQREVGFQDNPYGAFGWISKKDGSFRITIKPEPGKKGKARGKVCQNFHVPDLIDIFVNKLQYLPKPHEDYDTVSKADLIKRIKGKTGFSEYKQNLESKTEDELRGLLTLLTLHIDELCAELRQWFADHDLLYEM